MNFNELQKGDIFTKNTVEEIDGEERTRTLIYSVTELLPMGAIAICYNASENSYSVQLLCADDFGDGIVLSPSDGAIFSNLEVTASGIHRRADVNTKKVAKKRRSKK